MRKFALPFLFLLTSCDVNTKSAGALAERIMGEQSGFIRFETLKDEPKNVYSRVDENFGEV